MATCPKCGGAMAQNAAVCPHCGYDFPFDEADFRHSLARQRGQKDYANSDFADLILGLASFLFGLGALAALVGLFIALFTRHWALFGASIPAFIIDMALSILCTRALNWKK